MSNRFLNQLAGIIKVNLRGERPERIINLALSRGIHIWDIKKTDDGMHMKVKISGFEALENICEENNYSLEIVKKEGVPFLKGILTRRLGFWVGAVIFIAALYFMASFIWFIDVSGNQKVDKSRIIMTAARYGIYPGAPRWTFSRSEVEGAMLRDLSELAYVKIDIQGVKATIEVVEKIFPREEISGPCHIVAAKEGVVEEVLVLAGEAQVEVGKAVSKGDILISGVVYPQKNPFMEGVEEELEEKPSLVRARGRVKARVWYQGYGECRLRTEKMLLSGKESSEIKLEIGGKTIPLKKAKTKDYDFSICEIKQKEIKTPMGSVRVYKTRWREQLKKITQYSEEEALSIAQEKAMKSLLKKMGNDKKIVDQKKRLLSSPSDSIIRVQLSVETIEDIARAEPINVSPNGN
ncbi:sporulation protein YqfD [Syntrophomonas wolfei]|jgi:similar to stage IV sporulation protein|uniref:Putative stage IV sporulation YqfD n=1 Tax=Syntrophomonas wolfei subsp. wolfei (strain DSM 2245B / Goettingen) TaxID=335541 RepID=Q0AWN4_SYNWW|nr:sporulation protein YqfD [Syntrophomonas wolfei]ABI68870.1 putative stage IV sporulation YqfD [Syntrophomonas wolfei subsp. wolfei str. Goettingen G311]